MSDPKQDKSKSSKRPQENTTVKVGKNNGTIVGKLETGDLVTKNQIAIYVRSEADLERVVRLVVEKERVNNYSPDKLPVADSQAKKQIAELAAAEKQVSAQGVPLSAQAAYDLGTLQAHARKYDEALDYFRQATQADPGFRDAYFWIAWVQLVRALQDRDAKKDVLAFQRLNAAQDAIIRTNPLDTQSLALRGFIANTFADPGVAQNDSAHAQSQLAEAKQLFLHILMHEPKNPEAHKGLGGVYELMGDLDKAIAELVQAVKLDPKWATAHYDLARAYEKKRDTDSAQSSKWCRKALAAYYKALEFMDADPAYTTADIADLKKYVAWLEKDCAEPAPRQRNSQRAKKKSSRTAKRTRRS